MEQDRKTPKGSGLRERTARLLNLPGESVPGLPRLELSGDRSLYLEHYRDILAYGREEIHVSGGKWILRIAGQGLEIKAMGAGELRIAGRILSLELL